MKNLETALLEAHAEIAALKAAQTPAQASQLSVQALTALVHKLGASEASLLAQVAALTAENETLKAAENDIEVRASRMAMDIAAGQGVPPVNISRGDGIKEKAQTSEDHLAAFAAITDPKERAEYWAKYQRQMLPEKSATELPKP